MYSKKSTTCTANLRCKHGNQVHALLKLDRNVLYHTGFSTGMYLSTNIPQESMTNHRVHMNPCQSPGTTPAPAIIAKVAFGTPPPILCVEVPKLWVDTWLPLNREAAHGFGDVHRKMDGFHAHIVVVYPCCCRCWWCSCLVFPITSINQSWTYRTHIVPEFHWHLLRVCCSQLRRSSMAAQGGSVGLQLGVVTGCPQ